MHNYLSYTGTRKVTPQSMPIPGEKQVENNAGGFVYEVSDLKKLERFLILGTEGGTYYVSEKDLTKQNVASVKAAIEADPEAAIKMIVEISDSGRAAKNDPTIFALAIAASANNPKARTLAFAALPKVCRIPTHLFHFVTWTQAYRGWGRSFKREVGNWYLDMTPEKLAYETVKYQSRDGMSNRDVLRLTHPKAKDPEVNSIFKWIVKGHAEGPLPEIILAYEEAKTANEARLVELITDFGLTREMLPTEALNSKKVWEALLEKIPITAMIRNLGVMTERGLIAPLSDAEKKVRARLGDLEVLKKGRVHPIAVLTALKIYQQGKGMKGSLSWTPVGSVVDALNDAFYLAFGAVEPIGKTVMLALDVSGSMTCGSVAGSPLTPRDASAALALVTANVEKDYMILGFSHELMNLTISPKQRLDDVVRYINRLPFGGTDCSLPMLYASKNKLGVDAFSVYTDSETWAGHTHPSQALRAYRNQTGRHSKLVVVGMVSNGFSIADPNDPGMLDVVGFDAATPNVISEFCR